MLKVTLVSNPGCHHCLVVKENLKNLKKDYPELVVEEIDMTTEEGIKLVQKFSILSSPGILINDEFFSMGIVTEEQFRKKFEELKKS